MMNLKRTCPACLDKQIRLSQVADQILLGDAICCRSCGAALNLARSGALRKMASGKVYQILLIGGVIAALFLSSWWVLVFTCLFLLGLEVVGVILGELSLCEESLCEESKGQL